jgi:hypothetical protein
MERKMNNLLESIGYIKAALEELLTDGDLEPLTPETSDVEAKEFYGPLFPGWLALQKARSAFVKEAAWPDNSVSS